MPLLPTIHTSLLRHALLQTGACVVVAVSGGPDSLCLLHLLWRLRDELQLHLHVVHLDHSFRGEQSAAEAAFVAAFAQQLGLPATIERRDVPRLAQEWRLNKQAAARLMRYGLLAEVAQALDADAVAVAHQADDQAETVLMHLLRGAGPAGLRGMRHSVPWHEWTAGLLNASVRSETQPPLVRPLLDISRATIEAYCDTHNLDPRHDPSNSSPRYTRSRVRTDLLPLLSVYNHHISDALAHTATICADDYDYLQQQLDACWPTLVMAQSETMVVLDRQHWHDLHPALQRYALRRAVLLLRAAVELRFEQIEEARVAVAKGVGTQVTLPGGVRLVVGYASFTLGRDGAEAIHNQPQLSAPKEAMAVPGSTSLGGGWQLEMSNEQPVGWEDDRWSIIIDVDRLDGQLQLRTRQPGDRFRPAGGAGSRRLQDFFVDAKLPRALRDAWPLLTTSHSIVWVVGLRADARFQAHAETRHRLWVRCYKG